MCQENGTAVYPRYEARIMLHLGEYLIQGNLVKSKQVCGNRGTQNVAKNRILDTILASFY